MFHVPNQHRIRARIKIRPRLIPTHDGYGNNGNFIFYFKGYEIFCQASDGMGWEHVSVTINRKRTPPWEIMAHVKDIFWDKEDTVIQFHPPESQYVNYHSLCLHLWRPIGIEIPLPDPEMVGPVQKKEVLEL